MTDNLESKRKPLSAECELQSEAVSSIIYSKRKWIVSDAKNRLPVFYENIQTF
jgi:hypothetical protein